MYVIVHTDRQGRRLVHDIHPDDNLADVRERAAGLETSAVSWGRPNDTYRVYKLVEMPQ